MSARSDIIRDAREGIQIEARTLAEITFAKSTLPLTTEARAQLIDDVSTGMGALLRKADRTFTDRELRRFQRDAVRVFGDRLSELCDHGTEAGHA